MNPPTIKHKSWRLDAFGVRRPLGPETPGEICPLLFPLSEAVPRGAYAHSGSGKDTIIKHIVSNSGQVLEFHPDVRCSSKLGEQYSIA